MILCKPCTARQAIAQQSAERGGTGISKSQVSRLCEEIDERVDAFLTRPIEGSIRMNSVPRTEFPTVRGTADTVDGLTCGSMRHI